MHWMFAYGSNMHLVDLNRWLGQCNLPPGRILQAEAAKLIGYRLVWNYYSPVRGGGAANIEPAPEDLHGVALAVDGQALKALDRKEGCPERYGRHQAQAILRGGDVIEAWVYIAQAEHVCSRPVPPTQHYRGLLIQGALDFGLPREHVEALCALQTCD